MLKRSLEVGESCGRGHAGVVPIIPFSPSCRRWKDGVLLRRRVDADELESFRYYPNRQVSLCTCVIHLSPDSLLPTFLHRSPLLRIFHI